MSMTKCYLESLPQSEQEAILGGIDNAYISPDEWVNDAENEPTDEELAEWARTLIEEDDEELNDPLVKCRICGKEYPISEMNTNGECPPCQRDEAQLIKPQPKGVKAGCFDI